MAGPDLDVMEAHVSVRNYVTQQPYITSDGQTSLDILYAECGGVEVLYEPTKTELSTATVKLPSLIAMPELRPLHQNFKDGDRVEIYDFQPDCGSPIFAGFIAPNGITEENGETTLHVVSTVGQLQWRRLRRIEALSTNAAGFYARCMAAFKDIVADDFLGTNPGSDYTAAVGGALVIPTFGSGFVKQTASAGNTTNSWINPNIFAVGFAIALGDVYLMEADFILNTSFAANAFVQGALILQKTDLSNPHVGGYIQYSLSGVGAFPQQQTADVEVIPVSGASYNPGQLGTNAVSFAMPASHKLSVYMSFQAAGMVTVVTMLDNIIVSQQTQPWVFDSTAYMPILYMQAGQAAADYVQATNWRVRKLLPVLNKGGRFNPQTVDNLTYQANFEDQLQFLQLIALKDNAEYREVYKPWPATDELELDAVGTLGKNASALLGYDQPGSPPAIGSPEVSPFPVAADFGVFATAPPFRFEEGWNLAEPPKLNTPSNLHANDILQVGASTAEAQVFYETWSPKETGYPQHSPTGATYPYFEQVVNDDRVGLQTLIKTLAQYELTRRTDTTPSLTLKVVEELPFAQKWRAGDTVYISTRSLRNNIEQNLRIFSRKWQAGSPVKEVTVGRGAFDDSMARLYREALVQSWLYDQSGTSPLIYTLANSGVALTTTQAGVDIPIPLDQYTTGTQLVYAALHWFADANVLNLQPFINGQGVYTTGLTAASNTDSGLVLVTQYFQAVGTYKIHFLNNDPNTRTLQSAFLVLRVKG